MTLWFPAVFVFSLQGAPPQTPPTTPPPPQMAEAVTCAQAQLVIDKLLIAADGQIERARQTNEPAQMRSAVEALQGTLRDVRAQLTPCAATAGADSHANHAPPPPPPAKKPPPLH